MHHIQMLMQYLNTYVSFELFGFQLFGTALVSGDNLDICRHSCKEDQDTQNKSKSKWGEKCNPVQILTERQGIQ